MSQKKTTHEVIAAEHAEMDWVPVSLDSPAGEGVRQSNKVSEPNFSSIKIVIVSFRKEPYSTAMTVSPRPALYICHLSLLAKIYHKNANFVRLAWISCV